MLQEEQDKVLQSPELKEKFSRVDGKLNTKDTQEFRDFIAEHQELLPEYQNLTEFKKSVILGYLQSQQNYWDDLVATFKQNQELVGNIIYQAQQQKTTWEAVVETFNKRFKVPFKLKVGNQDEVNRPDFLRQFVASLNTAFQIQQEADHHCTHVCV